MESSQIVLGKRYKFIYSKIEMTGVCTDTNGTRPWSITMRADDGQVFGIPPSMVIEEFE